MTRQKKITAVLIRNRQEILLDLIKRDAEPLRIERELALLILDVIDALETKSLSLKEGGQSFIKIVAALRLDTEARLSEEFRDLLNEAILLNELGTPYGPDLAFMRSLATKILQRDEVVNRPQLKKFVSLLEARHKRVKMPVAVV